MPAMLQRVEWTARPASLREALFRRSASTPPARPFDETEEMAEERIAAELDAIINRRSSRPSNAAKGEPSPDSQPSDIADQPIDVAAIFAKPATASNVQWIPAEAVTDDAGSVNAAAAAASWVDKARRERRRTRTHNALAWIATLAVGSVMLTGAAYWLTGWLPDFGAVYGTITDALSRAGG